MTQIDDDRGRRCPVCGGSQFRDRPVLWPELVAAWELSSEEVAVIDRQQGRTCVACEVNWRSMSLAAAIMESQGFRGLFRDFVVQPVYQSLRVLEINPAGQLSPWLAQLRGRTLAEYPAVDMQALPYADQSFDLVVHSDTLEHVPDPVRGLEECRRVLVPSGRCCYTVPIVVGRLSRSCADRPPSYHGNSANPDDYRVFTEFGADAWTWSIRAGFGSCRIHVWDYPAAMTLVAESPHRDVPLKPAKPSATAHPTGEGLPLPATGERLLPSMSGSIVREHIHRYALACQLARGRDVLDIASGEGYGSRLLAAVARSVVGVDVDPHAVAHARAKYVGENLRFEVGSSVQIPLADASVDVAVSFETIEHLRDSETFLDELSRVLRPDGVLVISTPNIATYRSGMTPNPYHLRELTSQEFETLLHERFQCVRLLGQRMWMGSVIAPTDSSTAGSFFQWSGDFQQLVEEDAEANAVYLIAVATNSANPPKIPWGLFACLGDTPIDPAELAHCQSQLQAVLHSTSWALTEPVRWVINRFRGRSRPTK